MHHISIWSLNLNSSSNRSKSNLIHLSHYHCNNHSSSRVCRHTGVLQQRASFEYGYSIDLFFLHNFSVASHFTHFVYSLKVKICDLTFLTFKWDILLPLEAPMFSAHLCIKVFWLNLPIPIAILIWSALNLNWADATDIFRAVVAPSVIQLFS